MSGGGGGSGVGNALMTAGLIAVGGAAILATGGLATPGVVAAMGTGGALGIAGGAAKNASVAAKQVAKQADNVTSSLLGQRKPAPEMPSATKVADRGVQQLRALQARSGRASTQLTTPGSQNTFGG